MLATAGGDATTPAIRALAAGIADWRRVLALGATVGAQPILATRLRANAGDLLPAQLTLGLERIERAARHRQGYLRQRLRDALGVLAAEGIPVMLLKGAALAHTVYAGFEQRPMSDVDLLVPPEQAATAQRLLLAHGWRPRFDGSHESWYAANHHHLPPLTDARAPMLSVGLELHTEILPADRNPFALSAPALWRDARPAPGLPASVVVPSAVHQFIHCCVHFAWSHMLRSGGWRTIRDVDALLRAPSFDVDALVAAARATRTGRCVYWTLRLARRLAAIDVPEAVMVALRPRIPDVLLRALERHFVHEVVDDEEICPSVLVRRLIVVGALQPRAVRHALSAGQEWHGPSDHQATDASDDDAYGERDPFAAWTRYLTTVLDSAH